MVDVPPLRRYGTRDLAVVYVRRKRHYLGAWGSPEALAEYRRIVARVRENQAEAAVDRVDPRVVADAAAASLEGEAPATVDVLCERYDAWARAHYTKRGKPTSQAHNIGRALTLLYRSGEAGVHPEDFGPRALTRFQRWLASHARDVRGADGKVRRECPWTRATINEYVGIVVGMFKWAAGLEWVRPEVAVGLKMVAPLRRGRAAAPGLLPPPEGGIVQPVPRDQVQRIRRRLPVAVRVMVDLQLLTGARPNEVCSMRVDELEPTEDPRVLAYRVSGEAHKLDHLGERAPEKVIYLGPKARRLLKPMLEACRRDGNPFLFSPQRTVEDHQAGKRAGRKTPKWPSHRPELRAMKRMERGGRPRKVMEKYTPNAYRKAIVRACAAAGIEPAWTPYRLRHNRATDLATTENLVVASKALGHASVQTTMGYVQVKDRAAPRRR